MPKKAKTPKTSKASLSASVPKETITVGLVQMRCVSSPSENLKTAVRLIRDAAKKGAEVVCLPELFLSEYFCQSEDHDYFKLAEAIPGPTTK